MSVRVMTAESRKPTSWRKRAYRRIAERDGASCAACGIAERYVWRKGGLCGAYEQTGDYLQIVHRCTNLELEHTVPLHCGGTNDDDNLRLLCGPCHRAKTSAEQSARLKALGAGRNAR